MYKKILILISLIYWANTSFAQFSQINLGDSSKLNIIDKADRLYADAVKANITGNIDSAESLFQKFIIASPKTAAGYFELARIQARKNNNTKAKENILTAIKLDDTNKWYKEFHANLLTLNGQYLQSAEIFTTLAEKYSPNQDYLIKAADLFLNAKQYDKAIQVLEKLLIQRPGDEDILLKIKQVYVADKKIDKAANTLKRLIEIHPKEGRYQALLAELYFNNKMEQEGYDILKNAEKKFPNDLAIQLGLAEYYKKNKDTVQYNDYFTKAIGNNTLDPDMQFSLLMSYLQDAGNDTVAFRKALVLSEQIVRKNPNKPNILAVYADLLGMNRQNDSAAYYYKQALKYDPNNLNVWIQLCFLYAEKNKANQLLIEVSEAISYYPNAPILYYLNGIGYTYLEQFPKAISAYETAIEYQAESNPTLLSEIHAALGDVFNTTKEYTKADEQFKKSLDLAPNNPTVLNNYAYYLSIRNTQLDLAEKMSAKSLELRPNESTFLDTYGWIFYKKGDYKKALQLIKSAIEYRKEESDGTLYDHLGDIYFRLNQIDEALDAWQKALLKNPNEEKIKEKIKQKKNT
jgi:tetratricopeptide (TPR) repeat protein